MAAFSNQRTFLCPRLRPYVEAIFGKLPPEGGVQWRTGAVHPKDKDPTVNSAAINDDLKTAGVHEPELVVVLLDP